MLVNQLSYPPQYTKPRHPIVEWIACALIGFSASSLAVKINIILLGSNLIEPYVFIGLCLLFSSNRILIPCFKSAIKSQFAVIATFILCALALLGFITGQGFAASPFYLISSIYSEFRAIFLFILFIALSLSKSMPISVIDRIGIKILTCLTIMDLVSITVFNNLQYDYFAEADRSSIICIAPLFLMGRALIAERVIPAVLCMCIIVAFTVISLMRANYMYIALGAMMLTYFSFRYLGSFRTSYKTFVLVAASFLILFLSIPLAMEYFNSNPIRLIHGLYRLQEIFGLRETMYGDLETARMGANKVIFYETSKFLIPQGLGATNHTPRVMMLFRDKYSVLSTTDSSFLYCVYHFGLLPGLIVISAIFYTCVKYCFKMLFMNDKRMLFTSAAYIFSFCVLFSLKSWTFMYWAIALQYALLIPWMFKYKEFYSYYSSLYDNKRKF